MENKTDFIEIDIFRLLKALWRNILIIIASAILLGAIAFSYARFFITPMYNASVLLYVNNSSFSVGSTSFSFSSSELSAAHTLVDTYIVILKTRSTLDDVIDKAGLNYSYEQLSGMISASAVNSTEIFRITVTSKDPTEAKDIANTIADVLPNKISDVVNGSSVRIVDYAVTPTSKASPNISKYAMIGVFLGIVISCALIILKDLRDDIIHSADMLPNLDEIPVLSEIPSLTSSEKSYGYHSYSSSKDSYGG